MELDKFDQIRSAMWISKQNGFPSCVLVGVAWRVSWLQSPNGIIQDDNDAEPSTGHAFIITGQKNINGTLYLKAHLSSGTNVGDNGYYYFKREIANKFLCALAFAEGNAEENKELWNLWQRLWDFLISVLKKVGIEYK